MGKREKGKEERERGNNIKDRNKERVRGGRVTE